MNGPNENPQSRSIRSASFFLYASYTMLLVIVIILSLTHQKNECSESTEIYLILYSGSLVYELLLLSSMLPYRFCRENVNIHPYVIKAAQLSFEW